MVDSTIYARAIVAGGADLQMHVSIEECLELALAILRLYRHRGTEDEIAEEVADVEIMCKQLRTMIGDEKVDHFKKAKLKRLQYRIDTNQMIKETDDGESTSGK